MFAKKRNLVTLAIVSIAFVNILTLGRASSAELYESEIRTDILVVGATPCGISAAIAAARGGSKVILTEPTVHIGGMMTSGLGRTDIGPRHSVDGIFGEYVRNIRRYYADTYGEESQQVKDSGNGYYFEPSAAETVLNKMVSGEKKINLRLHYQPEGVVVLGDRLSAVNFLDTRRDRRVRIRAGIIIDATYEGDVAAMAGVPYRIGRESREEQGEPYAGVIYLDHLTRMVLPGSTGKGDRRVQAYNFRLTLTKDPANQIKPSMPDNYNRDDYTAIFESIKIGRVKTFADVIETRLLPNGKYDANNQPLSLVSTDLPEENYGYPEASPAERERIVKRYRDYTLGLLYFLQNDRELPFDLRLDARAWGLAKDEYPDNNHFPRQIYVREARRIQGLYTFTAQDAMFGPGIERTPIKFDAIACGGYSIDSHATRKMQAGHDLELEGFFWLSGITQPYQIPYRIMIPQRINGLIVAGAVSATHLGFGTLRMEPVWMAMGQAAGSAAHIARQLSIEPRNVPVNRLQSWLAEDSQVLSVFSDVQGPGKDLSETEWQALQFYGTRGFFNSYEAEPNKPITRGTAAQWFLSAIRAGDFMTYYGPSVKHEGGGSMESSLKQLQALKIADSAGDPSEILTCGEMLTWLSRVTPWIDGSWGDKWVERVKPKDLPPAPANIESSDKPVTRSEFCTALYRRFRSTSPVRI